MTKQTRTKRVISLSPKQTKKLKNKSKKRSNPNTQLVLVQKTMPLTKSLLVKTKPIKVQGRGNKNALKVTVNHCEFLTDVVTPRDYGGGFILMTATINPGLSFVFPWSSKIAPSFESYSVKRCRFFYKPATSTLTKGVVLFSAYYNVDTKAPENKQDLLKIEGSKEGVPYSILSFDLQSGSSGLNIQKTYKIRTKSEHDLKLFDCAQVHFAYQAVQESGVLQNLPIGEIWIDYSIEFTKPVGKTSEIQIANIETLTGFGEVANSLTLAKPLGINLLSRFGGKLVSAGLKYVELNSGHYWETAKTITKSAIFALAGAILPPAVPLLRIVERIPSNLGGDDDQLGLKFNDDDDDSLISYCDTNIADVIAGTSTVARFVTNTNPYVGDSKEIVNSIALVDALQNATENRVLCTYRYTMLPGAVLFLTSDGTVIPTHAKMVTSDCDFTTRSITNIDTYGFWA